MANMEYNLLPAQALVVDPALGWEEGGIFALWNPEGCGNGGDPGKEGEQVKAELGWGKSGYLHNIICHSIWPIKIVFSGTDT